MTGNLFFISAASSSSGDEFLAMSDPWHSSMFPEGFASCIDKLLGS
jgi:hypothetical protein